MRNNLSLNISLFPHWNKLLSKRGGSRRICTTETQWRSNSPLSHLQYQPKLVFVYLYDCASCPLEWLVMGPLSHTWDTEDDLNWIHRGESVKQKGPRYKHSQSGSQYLLTWAAVLTASWCETGSCWLAWAWPAQCHWSHSTRLPACLPACPLPCQPALPALFTTSKPGTVRWAAVLKPIPAACCSSQHCEMASARRPHQRRLLRRWDYVWITSQHNHTTCIIISGGQRFKTDFLYAALQPGIGVLYNGHGRERRQSGWMLKLVLCLSVAEQFKDTDSPH